MIEPTRQSLLYACDISVSHKKQTPYLPDELIFCISTFLKAKELARASATNSQWYQVIKASSEKEASDQMVALLAMRMLFKQKPIKLPAPHWHPMLSRLSVCRGKIAYNTNVEATMLYDPVTGTGRKIADATGNRINPKYFKLFNNHMVLGDSNGKFRILNVDNANGLGTLTRSFDLNDIVNLYDFQESTGIAVGMGSDWGFILVSQPRGEPKFIPIRKPRGVSINECLAINLKDKHVTILCINHRVAKGGFLQSYSVQTRSLLYTCHFAENPVEMISNEKRIAVVINNRCTRLIDAQTGLLVRDLLYPNFDQGFFSWRSISLLHIDDHHLFTSTNDGLIQIWNLEQGHLIHTMITSEPYSRKNVSTFNQLLAVGYGTRISLWDMSTWTKLHNAKIAHRSAISNIHLHAGKDSAYLVARLIQGDIFIWHPDAKEPTSEENHKDELLQPLLSPGPVPSRMSDGPEEICGCSIELCC